MAVGHLIALCLQYSDTPVSCKAHQSDLLLWYNA